MVTKPRAPGMATDSFCESAASQTCAMASDKSKTLWGKNFRIVTEGLAETDVVIFVE